MAKGIAFHEMPGDGQLDIHDETKNSQVEVKGLEQRKQCGEDKPAYLLPNQCRGPTKKICTFYVMPPEWHKNSRVIHQLSKKPRFDDTDGNEASYGNSVQSLNQIPYGCTALNYQTVWYRFARTRHLAYHKTDLESVRVNGLE